MASIYRWSGSGWSKVGSAGLQLPDVNGPGSITALSLTGSPQPDFLVTGSGADWQPASVVSDIGGTWHAVLFDQGAGLTTLVDEGRNARSSGGDQIQRLRVRQRPRELPLGGL